MKTVDIRTPQQIVIRFELADLKERIVAFVLDQFILWTGLFILFFLLMALGHAININPGRFIQVLFTGIYLFYSLLAEYLMDGQSPGKKIMGLKIIKLSGGASGIREYIIRWSMRLLDIWASLGALASLMISSTPQAQRIGDLLADTLVIRLNSRQDVPLESLLRMHERNADSVIYPLAVRFKEEEMLLVLEMLERWRRHPSGHNKRHFQEISKRVAKEMDLEQPPEKPEKFLRQVLNDYVTLTR